MSDAQMRLRRLTRQQVKNRQAILNKVRKFWVEGVLATSLHDQVLIELDWEERADAVVSSWNMELETTDEAQKPLPKGTKVIAIFDQLGEGRTLLIFGESGAGKTTTLLELTRDLLNRAEQGLDYRIPVVFNLSSWVLKKQPIGYWLVEELNSKYQVPKSIGADWVEKQELLLLLDGLDEVKAEHRESCVAALNDLQQNYAPKMVVCSRIKDYEQLSNHLNFQSAVYLKPLTSEQIRHYLDSINADLTGLRALIKGNTALQELAKLPLMLNIMVLAYEGVAVEDLPKTAVVEERRKQLFDAYIERMFRRPTHLKVQQRYSEAQTKRWLTWLAQSMVQQSQTVFFIEKMQPTWLQGKGKRILCLLGIFLMSWLVSWPIGGLIGTLSYGLMGGSSDLLISWLFYGSIYGLSFGLISIYSAKGKIGEIKEIKENVKWYWKEARNGRRRLILSSIVGGGLFCWLYSRSIFELISNFILLLSFVLNIELICGGGKTCIPHLTLRLILYQDGYIPWNYSRFLDYAAERIFLQKVGDGYIFIHRLLLEHFAQIKLESRGL
ncbi:MAG: NACHT domain-containing protein [Cyanobacteriota bacterium]